MTLIQELQQKVNLMAHELEQIEKGESTAPEHEPFSRFEDGLYDTLKSLHK